MNRKGEKTMWWKILIPLLIILAFVFVKMFFVEKNVQFKTTDRVFYNPFMGFAVNADYEDAVGENTLVYVDITWREWEPEEGVYAIEQLWEDNNLKRWQEEGKKVVLRFVCDIPGEEEHMDIPDWLYELTGDGIFYDTSYGKGYAPEYSNAVFIEKHRAALLALGKAFEDEDLLAYVELGSLGHWGEWHMNYSQGTTRMPKASIREEYVQAYEEAFPYAKMLARRPFAETVAREYGLYNDMTGHMEDTKEWISWIENGGTYEQPLVSEELVAQPKAWESSPMGGEFTSSLSYNEMLVENLEETISLIKQSHMTFIGPKCPVTEEVETYSEGVEEVLKTIGYRYGVSEASISYWKWSNEGKLVLKVENSGIAPIYFPWEMYLYVYDGENLVERIQVPVNLMEIFGGESCNAEIENVPIGEGYTYWIGIENPATGEPEVYLDIETEEKNFMYQIMK